MIKLLKKYQIRSSPFDAAKDWALSNTNNQDLWLMEDTGSEVPVALEFLDYGDGSTYPVENWSCDMALEQQTDDRAIIREGLKLSGPFYPATEPQNTDGTFKRTIFSQVHTMFYNQYRNPTEIWGTEKLDFELSETRRLLSDRFRLLSIPQLVYGDKIVPTSVVITDENLDNLYVITDDGNGNLFAERNLFSRFQMVGEFTNSFEVGSSSFCGNYWNPPPYVYVSGSDSPMVDVGITSGSAELTSLPESASFDFGGILSGSEELTSLPESASFDFGITSGSLMEGLVVTSGSDSGSYALGIVFGSLNLPQPEANSASFNFGGILSGSMLTTIITMSMVPDTMSFMDSAWYSGSVIQTIITMSMTPDTMSFMDTAWYSGSVIQTILTMSMTPDTMSFMDSAWYSGSLETWVSESYQNESGSVDVGILSGSLEG